MAGRLSLWGAGEILQSFFGRSTEPPPSYYLALIKDIAPTPYVSGVELDEPSAEDGYQRVEITNEVTSWADSTGVLHVVANVNDLLYVTAVNDWGRIAYWALCNEQEGGYVYFMGDMEEELAVFAGDQVVITAGELSIELGPFFVDQDS
jgi:hypothetical protein